MHNALIKVLSVDKMLPKCVNKGIHSFNTCFSVCFLKNSRHPIGGSNPKRIAIFQESIVDVYLT